MFEPWLYQSITLRHATGPSALGWASTSASRGWWNFMEIHHFCPWFSQLWYHEPSFGGISWPCLGAEGSSWVAKHITTGSIYLYAFLYISIPYTHEFCGTMAWVCSTMGRRLWAIQESMASEHAVKEWTWSSVRNRVRQHSCHIHIHCSNFSSAMALHAPQTSWIKLFAVCTLGRLKKQEAPKT